MNDRQQRRSRDRRAEDRDLGETPAPSDRHHRETTDCAKDGDDENQPEEEVRRYPADSRERSAKHECEEDDPRRAEGEPTRERETLVLDHSVVLIGYVPAWLERFRAASRVGVALACDWDARNAAWADEGRYLSRAGRLAGAAAAVYALTVRGSST